MLIDLSASFYFLGKGQWTINPYSYFSCLSIKWFLSNLILSKCSSPFSSYSVKYPSTLLIISSFQLACFFWEAENIPASKHRCTIELYTTTVMLFDMLSNPFPLIHSFTCFLTVAEYWDDFSMQWWLEMQRSHLWVTIENSELIPANKKEILLFFLCDTFEFCQQSIT